jgi:hypothetical protein
MLISTALTTLTVSMASAAELSIEAVMSPQEQIRYDLEDDSKRIVMLVHRAGTASGTGLLDGASVDEYGMHSIVPGVDGNASGYLVFEDADGDKAYADWNLRAVFVPGAEEGKMMLLDNGVWEIVGGTGKHQGLQGAGTLNMQPVNATDRNYILKGNLVPAN